MQCMGIINKSILLACLLAHIIRGGGKERKIGSDIYTKKEKKKKIMGCYNMRWTTNNNNNNNK